MDYQGAQDILKTTLANSAAFQVFVDADDATEAAQRIYHDAVPLPAAQSYTLDELNELRPYALLFTDPSGGFRSDKVAMGDSSGDCWNSSGTLIMYLVRTVPAASEGATNPLSDVDTSFRTIIGNVLADLAEMSETAGMLASRSFLVDGPYRNDPVKQKNEGDEQMAIVTIRWGLQ